MSRPQPRPVPAGEAPTLSDEEAAAPAELSTGKALDRELRELRGRLAELGAALRAEKERALLVVLQSRDTGGKDGVVEKVFGAVLPQHLSVQAFEEPSDEERSHDFLWRVHAAVPAFGRVGVFNRSHYEEVVTARVHRLVPEEVWTRRFRQINDFERMLTENGVAVVKLFLHISRDEQRRRLRKRLEKAEKQWEFDPNDLDDRERWDEFTEAYRDAIARCGTDFAPWYVVPADDKSVRNLLVARIAVAALERLDPQYPEPDYDVDAALARLG
ncbi:MAG TPA: PPK2 family polyphosphate kinase [Longimicrobiaceae bacterium]|nr:PPK2 family polyphosphate kinase [Longimicrobiaceae bacterium]